MSKVVKGIKKVFKKVVKVVKKVAPIILAAAAIYFTAGAALGVVGTAGGWGAAAGSISTSVGATGTLGSVLTGAITQAGYGAVIGGVMSSANGGSFSEGAGKGAIAGAVTGGVMGGFGGAAAPTAQPTAGVTPPPATGIDPTTMSAADEAAAMGGNFSHETGMASVNTATPPPVNPASTPTPTPPPNSGSGLAKGGWLERNQSFAGSMVSGLGQGLMAKGAGDAEIDALRERQKIINENYSGANPSAGFTPLAASKGGQSPMDRFDPNSYGAYEYQYNPQSGRIERVARS